MFSYSARTHIQRQSLTYDQQPAPFTIVKKWWSSVAFLSRNRIHGTPATSVALSIARMAAMMMASSAVATSNTSDVNVKALLIEKRLTEISHDVGNISVGPDDASTKCSYATLDQSHQGDVFRRLYDEQSNHLQLWEGASCRLGSIQLQGGNTMPEVQSLFMNEECESFTHLFGMPKLTSGVLQKERKKCFKQSERILQADSYTWTTASRC